MIYLLVDKGTGTTVDRGPQLEIIQNCHACTSWLFDSPDSGDQLSLQLSYY